MRPMNLAILCGLLLSILMVTSASAVDTKKLDLSALDPLAPLSKFLADKGWVAFYVPSARFSAGSVITPDGQDLKLDSANCFPKLKTPLAQLAALPEIERGHAFEASTGLALLKGLLGSVTGSVAEAVAAQVAFSEVKHVAVDIKSLADAYSPSCDPFLKLIRNPVVISELLIGKPSVTFLQKDGGKVNLSAEKVKKLFNVKGAANVDVRDSATLVTKDALFFAYKAVTPVRQDGKLFFVSIEPTEITPNYFAVWEHEITKWVGARRRPGDPLDPKHRI